MEKMNTVRNELAAFGTITLMKVLNGPQPSRYAASSSSFGSPRKNCLNK